MKQEMGGVLPLFDRMPDELMGAEWDLLRRHMRDGLIPRRYRELIGLGTAATLGSRHMVLLQTELAADAGCTDAEVEEAARHARLIAGWATYANGIQVDFERFAAAIAKMSERRKRGGTWTGPPGGTP